MRNKAWILTAAAMLTLAACSRPASAPVPPPAAAAPHSGIDLAGRDLNAKPGDDFDNYANGAWRAATEIPADRSSVGVFYQVFLKAEQRNAELVREAGAGNPAAGSNARRIADDYAAYMDEAGIEKLGLAPLQPALDEIGKISNGSDLARVLGSGVRADVDPINNTNLDTEHLFGVFVAQGLEDPTHNVAYLLQGGLGMPNRDYYLDAGPEMAAFRAKYQAYVADLLKLAGNADSDPRAKAVFELEMKIAKAHASIVDSSDIHKANNPWPSAEFATRAPGLDWKVFLDAAGLAKQDHIVAWQPDAIRQLSALVASQPLQTWKDYLSFHALNESADLLPKAYAQARFEFYGHTLQGTPQQRERWKRAVGQVSADLGDAVGQEYVNRYFPASSKARVEQMVANISAAFGERVDTLEWMTPATKQKAKAKAASMRVSVGYPETWRDYSSLAIRRDDPLGNRLRSAKFEYLHQLAKLDQPVDRGEWWMTPQTVNAVNLPLQNALNFPAAILEAPFFDPQADDAANYGAIGAIIGHEISHGFDNLGAEFDDQGRLANWWTPEDQAHFKAAGDALAAQFSAYEPLPGLHINGQQTLGENIADVSGLSIALAAYHKSLGGKPAPVIDGLSGDQRFFLAFAQAWRGKVRDAALRQQVVADGHAPGRFRALTVRNIDGWYEAFGAKPGEAMYLDPKTRVRIW